MEKARVYTQSEEWVRTVFYTLKRDFTAEEYDQFRKQHRHDLLGMPSARELEVEFGSLEKAKKAAKVLWPSKPKTEPKIYIKWHADACLDALSKYQTDNGKWITAKEYDQWRRENQLDLPDSVTIRARFGHWHTAVKKAGLRSRAVREQSWTKQEVLQFIKQAAEKYGDDMTINDYNAWRLTQPIYSAPPYKYMLTYFESWREAKIAAGLSGGLRRSSRSSYTQSEIIDALRYAYRQLGGHLTQERYEKWRREIIDDASNDIKRLPSLAACHRTLPSWKETVQQIHTEFIKGR